MNLQWAKLRLGAFAAGLVSIVWGFQAMLLQHAPSVFNAQEEDMSFAWFVPLFSLYVVYADRARIRSVVRGPSWGGLAAMLPFLALGFLGARGIQVRFEIVAFAGLMVAWPWCVFGRGVARRMLFPALFLLFCIPLATYLDIVTVHLRLLATTTAYGLLKAFGVGVVRQGTMLATSNGFSIDVAAPCSGLRSIFALMALTAGYAYFNQRGVVRRLALFACSVPIAIIANIARIITICVVAECASSEFALGFYHDYSGYVVFGVAIVLMIAAGEGIARVADRIAPSREEDAPGAAEESAADASASRAKSALVPVVAGVALLACAMVYQAAAPEVTIAEPPPCALAELDGYESVELGASEAELTTLPGDTRIEKRRYISDDGDWFQVTLVVGGKSKSSIHRPELCLPAQGLLMTSPRTVGVDGVDWRIINLESAGYATHGFAYTFFNQAGFRTSSHARRIFRDVWDRSVLNRVDRWVMVTVTASRADDAVFSGFLSKLKGVVECSR